MADKKRRELFAPGYGTGFKMWIAVESLRCAESELGRVAQRYHVPLEMVRRCRSIAFRALEEAFWKEDPCRLVSPPSKVHRRRAEEQEKQTTGSTSEMEPSRFVEKLLHRVHLKSSQASIGRGPDRRSFASEPESDSESTCESEPVSGAERNSRTKPRKGQGGGS